ncbi:hypothetical protein, partial [Streptomyces mirabilis]|uniref:hypothetical protein n=1 Tax=Streptomyces mirabilis TaxID=68239 RepID=UPI0036A2A7B6
MDSGGLLDEAVFDGSVVPATGLSSDPCSEGPGEAESDAVEVEPECRGEDRAFLPAGAVVLPPAEAEKPGMSGTSVSEAVWFARFFDAASVLLSSTAIAVAGGVFYPHPRAPGQHTPPGSGRPPPTRENPPNPG